MSSACERCLARAWLLARLAAHLEPVRSRIAELLPLANEPLIDAVAGKQRISVQRELARFDASAARAQCREAGLATLCRCDSRYPARLRDLEAPPAVLHVAGELERLLNLTREQPVAVVGARRASPYGLEVARGLALHLSRAGVSVLSGMALGVDSAAHTGALSAPAGTVAVLCAAAQRPYPPARRALHRKIQASGAVISELPPHASVWRWMFPARNRIVAALSAMLIVVEAGERSGALLTARAARALRRPVGAVPGRVTAPQAAGPNALLADGAYVIRDAQDVLDVLYGAGTRRLSPVAGAGLAPELRVLLGAIADGHDMDGALAQAGVPADQGLAALAALELAGYVRREPGGRFSATS
jgi:DNA processing protein